MDHFKDTIRKIDFTTSDQDFENLWSMWQTIFPKWPIERERLQKIMYHLPGLHYIHEKGFCLSYLSGSNGKIAAVGVLPDYRGKGLGTAFLKIAQEGLREAAHTNEGGELKTLEIGSQTPRFWPGVPIDFPQEVKDFFIHRGTFKPNALSKCWPYQVITKILGQQFEIISKISDKRLRHLPSSRKSQRESSKSFLGHQTFMKNAWRSRKLILFVPPEKYEMMNTDIGLDLVERLWDSRCIWPARPGDGSRRSGH